MPELPEVEITCQGIKRDLLNHRINHILVRETRLRWPIPNALKKLKNLKVSDVSRRAKYILIKTNEGILMIHLGMSGRLKLTQCKDSKKHDHVDFVLDNGKILRYTDPRRFGSIHWIKESELNKHKLLANLGPEPLSSDFDAEYLFEASRNKKINLKKFIMDQDIVVGVGNIYANEALFLAKLSPLRPSNTLTIKESRELVKVIKQVLKAAIKKGGTTLKDFLAPDGNLGYFVQKLVVYGREGEKCAVCGKPLESIRINQRATVYCKNCQK